MYILIKERLLLKFTIFIYLVKVKKLTYNKNNRKDMPWQVPKVIKKLGCFLEIT